jgi:hypothetical protein
MNKTEIGQALRHEPKDLALNTSYQIIKKIKQDYDRNTNQS